MENSVVVGEVAEVISVTYRVTSEVARRLRLAAAMMERPASHIVQEALDRWLTAHEEENGVLVVVGGRRGGSEGVGHAKRSD